MRAVRGVVKVEGWPGKQGITLGLDMMDFGCVGRFNGVCDVPEGSHVLRVGGGGGSVQMAWFWMDNSCTVVRYRYDVGTEELVLVGRGHEEGEDDEDVDGLERYHQADDSWRTSAATHIDASIVMLSELRLPLGPRTGYDETERLEQLLSSNHHNVLGLMQRLFLHFTLANDLDAFEGWRTLVILFCSCVKGLRTRTELFVQFSRCLAWQMTQAGEELLWDSSNNVFVRSISVFSGDVLGDPESDPVLIAAARSLQGAIGVSLLAEEDPEDMPAIVDDDE